MLAARKVVAVVVMATFALPIFAGVVVAADKPFSFRVLLRQSDKGIAQLQRNVSASKKPSR
jgi:hypothetical protein